MVKWVKSVVSRDVPPAINDGQSRATEHDASRLHVIRYIEDDKEESKRSC